MKGCMQGGASAPRSEVLSGSVISVKCSKEHIVSAMFPKAFSAALELAIKRESSCLGSDAVVRSDQLALLPCCSDRDLALAQISRVRIIVRCTVR